MSTKTRYVLAAIVVAASLPALWRLGLGIPSAKRRAVPVDAGPPTAVALPKDLIRICEYPKVGRPWDLRNAVRVRLDGERSRARGINRDDLMRAMSETSLIPETPIEAPPPGVVFVHRLGRPDRLGETILKENPDGELVRLKDVATVEAGW